MTSSPPPIPERFRDRPPPPPRRPRSWQRAWLGSAPFFILHGLPFLAIWTGVHWQDVACCVILYVTRMFGVTAGYHRYFSHRSYKTSRVFQLLLALLAMSSAQRGVLWWAAHHRHHHRFSDTPWDVHSPIRGGFWHAHVLWILDANNDPTDLSRVRDLVRFPELLWLNRFWYVPPVVLGAAVAFTLGWSGLLIGFALSTVLVWHGTFAVNSLAHVFGRRRYETEDTSRNSWILALVTLGEGWHNNHHHHMSSARAGFLWWEVDVTYYILRALATIGVVWDIREPTAAALAAPPPVVVSPPPTLAPGPS